MTKSNTNFSSHLLLCGCQQHWVPHLHPQQEKKSTKEMRGAGLKKLLRFLATVDSTYAKWAKRIHGRRDRQQLSFTVYPQKLTSESTQRIDAHPCLQLLPQTTITSTIEPSSIFLKKIRFKLELVLSNSTTVYIPLFHLRFASPPHQPQDFYVPRHEHIQDQLCKPECGCRQVIRNPRISYNYRKTVISRLLKVSKLSHPSTGRPSKYANKSLKIGVSNVTQS